jgi:hypothetical protein
LIEHGPGVPEYIGLIMILWVVIDPVLRRNVIFVEGYIIRPAGNVITIIAAYHFEWIQVEI